MQRNARTRRGAVAAAIAVGALLLSGCGPTGPAGPPASSGTVSDPSAEPPPSGTASPSAIEPGRLDEPVAVATGLDAPWSIAFVDERTALVSERDSGTILEVSASGAVRELAQVAGLSHGGEGGLLGLAVGDGHLYWYGTAADGNRVMRVALTGEPGSLELGQPQEVITGIPASGNHNGGRIAFGPDRLLYVTTGDAGVPGAAQDPGSLAGKILRLEPDGTIPADNPFPGSPVYSLGHRNPQGIAWDEDGTMWASEFGQDTWDELNRIEAGANYGWPQIEGIAGVAGFTDPVQQWQPTEASPSGIAIAEGSIWIANLRGASLRQVPLTEPSASTVHWQGRFGRMRDVAVAPDGSLWVLTGNTDGRGSPADGDDRILALAP
ncbi:Glucose/arabinose dehydrogenase, beta-propeller fold [Agrococcus baldri]|uniref:Glucose/arabinose dehydrogenase, beta-propeller fold n=1 Tax=Agrococcus baldri TaxID=153730 RepID=A0AA94KY96_9MICO|nr:PQQ-dependent sugar dehydrogenase [Agrococcus baldri]SFR96864.1 Glucose/arabinose dehydrogenase, beta-propeller fold [Agrococcus baldri]